MLSLKHFLVSSNDQVRCNCRTNIPCSSKESYSLRCSCLKLKFSCSKCSRCRYCVNGKSREAHPFKNKLNSWHCRSRGKSESLSQCSNAFGNNNSRCPSLKSKRACSTDCVCIDTSVERSWKQQEKPTRGKGGQKVCEQKNCKLFENARTTASAQYVDTWREVIALLHSAGSSTQQLRNNNRNRPSIVLKAAGN